MNKIIKNEMKLEFLSKSNNESFARIAVACFASQIDPTIEEVADIKTSVSEAVTNAIIHGYKSKDGNVLLEVSIYSDRSVRITVSDRGCGIADVEQAKLPLFTTDESGERGGMGFAIMESFSDRLKVKSVLGRGTTVTMTKKLK